MLLFFSFSLANKAKTINQGGNQNARKSTKGIKYNIGGIIVMQIAVASNILTDLTYCFFASFNLVTGVFTAT